MKKVLGVGMKVPRPRRGHMSLVAGPLRRGCITALALEVHYRPGTDLYHTSTVPPINQPRLTNPLCCQVTRLIATPGRMEIAQLPRREMIVEECCNKNALDKYSPFTSGHDQGDISIGLKLANYSGVSSGVDSGSLNISFCS